VALLRPFLFNPLRLVDEAAPASFEPALCVPIAEAEAAAEALLVIMASAVACQSLPAATCCTSAVQAGQLGAHWTNRNIEPR